MLLNAVIIVLRETLEAGVLVSILLSISSQLTLGHRWLWWAFAAGIIGAIVYAVNLGRVSEWFDYVGQEVVNAMIQYAIYISLVVLCMAIYFPHRYSRRSMMWLLGVIAVLASVREGSEIIIFYSGFLHDSDMLVRAATSGFIGLMIGISVGALCYHAIVSCSDAAARTFQLVLLSLVAAGMVAQASQLLVQADWLPSSAALWDTSEYLPESSIVGQLAYATFGYEASPTPVEAYLYFTALMFIVLLPVGLRYGRRVFLYRLTGS